MMEAERESGMGEEEPDALHSLLDPHRAVITLYDERGTRLPPVVMEDFRLDGLSRERILQHVETLLSRRLGVSVVATMVDDLLGLGDPIIVVSEGERIRTQGWIDVHPAPSQL